MNALPLPAMASKYRDIGDVGAVGIEFVLCLGFGYYGGHYLDGRFFGAHGYATGVGCVIGVGAAFKANFDASKRATLRLEELDREEAAARKKGPSLEALKDKVDKKIDDIERDDDGR